MKRLLASVAISALALSGAAFAADAPTAVQKDQAPMAQTTTPTTTPTKPSTVDSHAKKPAKKAGRSSMTTPAAPTTVQKAQAPATQTPAKPAADSSHAKKPAMVKKSDSKASTGSDAAQPATSAKPASH
jgi:hypothetical protein